MFFKSKNDNTVLKSPIKGQIIKLENMKDQAFASGILGQGVGIWPTEGKVFSPINGTVTMIFPTSHAVSIRTDSGVTLLIHIGMDTVQLDGKFYKSHVKDGQRVKEGQLLIEFDLNGITNAGFNLETPIVVTNSDEFSNITVCEKDNIEVGEDLLIISK